MRPPSRRRGGGSSSQWKKRRVRDRTVGRSWLRRGSALRRGGDTAAPALGPGRRQRPARLPHPQKCLLPWPTSPEGSPMLPCITRPGSCGERRAPGGTDTRCGPACGVAARRGSLWCGRTKAGPACHLQDHTPALRRGPSARAAAAQLGLLALRPPRSVRLVPRTGGGAAPAAPPPPALLASPYLLGEGDERGRHLPADSGSERRGNRAGPRVRTGARGGARAARPGRGRGRSRAAQAQRSQKGRGLRAGPRAPSPSWRGRGPGPLQSASRAPSPSPSQFLGSSAKVPYPSGS